ncbi:lactonase family protein, partial [Aquiflexum sp.]|uniref:lactonase family protein n=1 Tax=Aquiflexum sp. TaxID=1872584 RepID=UPI003593FD62
KEILYVGTYTERDSEGIYVFEFDKAEGKLTIVQTISDRDSPTYLDIHPNGGYLYAANRQGTMEDPDEGSVSTFQINQKTGELKHIGTVSSGGVSPCHISVDPKARAIYVSHYASSHISVFSLHKKGHVGPLVFSKKFKGSSINPDRQKESHLHSIIPSDDGKYIYASDLGTDLIHQFGVNGKSKKLKVEHLDSAQAKPGAGPRHYSIHPSGQFAFSVEELGSTVAMYSIDPKTGGLAFKDRANMIVPSDNFSGSNTAADIQITPDGKFVYASNRGLDNIAIFSIDQNAGKIKYIGQESSHGKHPRSFAMDRFGEYLFVTNRDTDNLVILKIDKDSGMLSKTGIEVKVPGAVVVKQGLF